MKLRDTLERLWWTFVAAFLATLLSSPVLVDLMERLSATAVTIDISLIGYAVLSGAVAGLTAVANAVLLIARHRLSILPEPGDGLPGLPVLVDHVIPVNVQFTRPTGLEDARALAREIDRRDG